MKAMIDCDGVALGAKIQIAIVPRLSTRERASRANRIGRRGLSSSKWLRPFKENHSAMANRTRSAASERKSAFDDIIKLPRIFPISRHRRRESTLAQRPRQAWHGVSVAFVEHNLHIRD